MKTTTTLKATKSEETFSVLAIVALIMVSALGSGTAILAYSAIGLAGYVLLFPDRFRGRRGSLRRAVGLVAALWATTAVVIAVSLIRGHLY